ncbi:hypothetical protein QE152_g10232 [Popillia japonica]|uniref:Uncharacterized protein n=1 Tax=Popillia japonica TaxID=7064 RepID=A0AAW1LU52_POPJA
MHEMLYGEPQKSDERGLEFIWRKRRLCQRLYPDWTEDNVISLIKRQMRTEYKVALGPHRYCSINELRAACIDIDELFHDTKRKNYLTPSSNSSSIKNKPKPPTPSQREVPKCRHCPEKHWHRDCPVLKQKSGGRTADRPQYCVREPVLNAIAGPSTMGTPRLLRPGAGPKRHRRPFNYGNAATALVCQRF